MEYQEQNVIFYMINPIFQNPRGPGKERALGSVLDTNLSRPLKCHGISLNILLAFGRKAPRRSTNQNFIQTHRLSAKGY